MPELKTYDLFISHSWSYGDAYENFAGFLMRHQNLISFQKIIKQGY